MDIEKIANYLATQSLFPLFENGTDVRVTANRLVGNFLKHKDEFSPEEQEKMEEIIYRAREIIYGFSDYELPE